MHRPMTAADFSCDQLANAWKSYSKAIAYIEQRKAELSPTATALSNTYNKLIESHRDKIACLERAQRIINTEALVRRTYAEIAVDNQRVVV